MYDICDIHSHILPGMDDGCATEAEALAVLQKMQSQGISRVVATPHYYGRETVSDFLSRREDSLSRLRDHAGDAVLPEICCGAEVAWYANIAMDPDVDRLCIGNSRFLLLELPFSQWSSQVLRDVDNLCLRGITPILAHLERYTQYQSKDMMRKLLRADVLVQMNADTVLKGWQGIRARSAIKRGEIHLLGSDCHGLNHRASQLAQAIALLEKKKYYGVLEEMEDLSNAIFQKAR